MNYIFHIIFIFFVFFDSRRIQTKEEVENVLMFLEDHVHYEILRLRMINFHLPHYVFCGRSSSSYFGVKEISN